ncbi:MAG: GDYXXLXY domain-containing protein [Alphaproteobacteria bacterium]|jgi:uncharacterized membrane-anchored protein|nr:GDYXXLXY domain-containing protein [Alphaproteobacteria bacterium]
MRKALVALAVLAQFLVLAVMAAEREYIVRYGRTVYLRTAPIDPRDVFRGDFVRLQYEISIIGPRDLRGDLPKRLKEKGRKVYSALTVGPDGLAELAYASDAAPAEGPYIRGRLIGRVHFGGPRGAAQVKYGIEQLFVEQGAGRAIEKRRGQREGLQVPLEVELGLSEGGTAVIKGYRWSRLGVRLEVLWSPPRRQVAVRGAEEGPLGPKLRVTLKNVSGEPLALANPGQDCGFELVATVWARGRHDPVDRSCETVRATDADLILLAPEASHSVALDLSRPRWHVGDGDKTGEIGRLARSDRFRLVYRAPPEAVRRTLSNPDRVWAGRLPTPAFNSLGRLD